MAYRSVSVPFDTNRKSVALFLIRSETAARLRRGSCFEPIKETKIGTELHPRKIGAEIRAGGASARPALKQGIRP
jgi:hypothetical protein